MFSVMCVCLSVHREVSMWLLPMMPLVSHCLPPPRPIQTCSLSSRYSSRQGGGWPSTEMPSINEIKS